MGRQAKIKRERRQSGGDERKRTGELMMGQQPRHPAATLDNLMRQVEAGAATVSIGRPDASKIRRVFVEAVRQMESDERNDGACHMLAAMTHVLLKESGVEDADLVMGDVTHKGILDDEDIPPSSFSHSWNVAGDILIDVAIARPLTPVPYRTAPTFGGYFMPSGDESPMVYALPMPLDHMAAHVLGMTLGQFVEGARDLSGLNFWTWWASACRKLGLASTAEQLALKYGGVRWHRLESQQGRDIVLRMGPRKIVPLY